MSRELRAPAEPLTDGTVTLREWRAEDAATLVPMLNEEAIGRFTLVPQPYGEDDARRWLATHGRDKLTGRAIPFAIVDSASGDLLGSVDLRVPDWEHMVGELGYLVAAPARGRGVAPAAVRLLSDWGLGEVGLGRIEIYVEPGNDASARVAEKAGFEREGLLRAKRIAKGGRADMYVFARVK